MDIKDWFLSKLIAEIENSVSQGKRFSQAAKIKLSSEIEMEIEWIHSYFRFKVCHPIDAEEKIERKGN